MTQLENNTTALWVLSFNLNLPTKGGRYKCL